MDTPGNSRKRYATRPPKTLYRIDAFGRYGKNTIWTESLHLCNPFLKCPMGKSPPDFYIPEQRLINLLSGCDNFSTIAVATVLYNVLDFPAGCLPVTRVDPMKDQLTEEWRTGPGLGSSVLEAGVYRGRKPLYDPVAMKGMPVGIQLVGKKWEEEKVLAMMRIVDRALGQDRGFGPGSWDAHKALGKGT